MNFKTQIFRMKKEIKKHSRHNFSDFFLGGYTYDTWLDKPNHKKKFENEKEEIKFGDLSDIPPEGDEEEIADLSSMPLL